MTGVKQVEPARAGFFFIKFVVGCHLSLVIRPIVEVGQLIVEYFHRSPILKGVNP
jgi:hypothetical protein